jgi:hypothetical protein
MLTNKTFEIAVKNLSRHGRQNAFLQLKTHLSWPMILANPSGRSDKRFESNAADNDRQKENDIHALAYYLIIAKEKIKKAKYHSAKAYYPFPFHFLYV